MSTKAEQLALLQKKLSMTKTKLGKAVLEKKIEKMKSEMGSNNKAKKDVTEAKKKISQLSISELKKKPEFSFLKGMNKGKIADDKKRVAKPKGWRFKGKGKYRKPTASEIVAGKKRGNVYYEARNRRSDVSKIVRLKTGGTIKGPNTYNNRGEWKQALMTSDAFMLTDKKADFNFKLLEGKITYKRVGDKINAYMGSIKIGVWDTGLNEGYIYPDKFKTGGGVEGETYICEKEGRIDIYSGTDARSAEVKFGDTFVVTEEMSNGIYYLGKLKTKGSFKLNPGLSGKDVSESYYGNQNEIIYLLRKQNIGGDSDFFAQFKKIHAKGGGVGEHAKGSTVTINEGVIESFLSDKKELKVGNLSTHYSTLGDVVLLRNYGTLIAKRKGKKVSISTKKYSKTTSVIQNMIERIANRMGLKIEKIGEDEFAKGGYMYAKGSTVGGQIKEIVEIKGHNIKHIKNSYDDYWYFVYDSTPFEFETKDDAIKSLNDLIKTHKYAKGSTVKGGNMQEKVDDIGDVGSLFYLHNKYPDFTKIESGAELGDVTLVITDKNMANSNADFVREVESAFEHYNQPDTYENQPDVNPSGEPFKTGGGVRDYKGLSNSDKFISDQLYYVISVKSISEKKKIIKDSLLTNIDDYVTDKMTNKITKDNLKYALQQKTVASIDNVLRGTINAFRKTEYATGGGVDSIPNNYENKSVENIWNSWNIKQREHFLTDHQSDARDEDEVRGENAYFDYQNIQEWILLEYKDLPRWIRPTILHHIDNGQYAKGGGVGKECKVYAVNYFKSDDEKIENIVVVASSENEAKDKAYDLVGGFDDVVDIEEMTIAKTKSMGLLSKNKYAKGGGVGKECKCAGEKHRNETIMAGGKNPEADKKVNSLIISFAKNLRISPFEAADLIKNSLKRLGY